MDRNADTIVFSESEVDEFDVSQVVTVQSALETALSFEGAAKQLQDTADAVIDSEYADERNLGTQLRQRAGALCCFARGVRRVCTPDEILEAELRRVQEGL